MFNIEENRSFDNKNSFGPSSDSDDDDLDLDTVGEYGNKKGRRDCPGVNVSPNSIVEARTGRNKNGDPDHMGSLNSSRMTGTQELSIHEGM